MTPAPCPTCGQPVLAGKRVCHHCGTALPTPCPTCGAATVRGARFCADCGAPLPTVPAASSPLILEQQFAAFQRSLPTAVRTQILTQPEGENRVLTILFADLTGSTARTAGLHPEEAAALIDGVLKAMVDAVLKYEGRINRLLGDAVLAYFSGGQTVDVLTRSHGGLGLSLLLARRAAEAHGGHLGLAPSAQGACVVLWLPAAGTQDTATEAPPARS